MNMHEEACQNYLQDDQNEVPTLRIAQIVGDSIVDGPGPRVSIFAQGCSHHCKGCHNPQTWNENCGTLYMGDELIELITTRYPITRAVTFTGGEPFDQSTGFGWLALQLSKLGYSIAAYTGYTFEELVAECRADNDTVAQFLCMCDVLVDGRYDESQRDLSLKFRGSRNQRILDVAQCFERSPVTPFIKVDEGWA